MFDPAVVDLAVSFRADLVRRGAALELGIGTGAIALPLSQPGVRVHASVRLAMVAQMQSKEPALTTSASRSLTSPPRR